MRKIIIVIILINQLHLPLKNATSLGTSKQNESLSLKQAPVAASQEKVLKQQKFPKSNFYQFSKLSIELNHIALNF